MKGRHDIRKELTAKRDKAIEDLIFYHLALAEYQSRELPKQHPPSEDLKEPKREKDAVKILHNRYIKNDPERIASLEKERVNAQKERNR